MIGKQTNSFLSKAFASTRVATQQQAAMTQMSTRGFAGGAKRKPAIDPKETNFDVVFVGGLNAAALAKFTQQHPDASDLKMAVVSAGSGFIQPQAYFGVCHSHIANLKLESGTVAAMVENWSKTETLTNVTKVDPVANTLDLSNGKSFTYKSLVLAPGFHQSSGVIKGLEEMEFAHESNNVFVHALDGKPRVLRNFWNGWNNVRGDLICYMPNLPFKGEGNDFYALYYEHFLRQDKMQTRASEGAQLQVWTPNKQIYQFSYANEVALDECHKRGIEVMFGWEMLEVKTNEFNEKIAIFRNVDSGEVIEKDFNGLVASQPSRPHEWIKNAGLADSKGFLDVNKYTLQHKKFENVFGFGSCVGFDTTRTQSGAVKQNPVVKHNLLQFLHGRDTNAIYDGYQFIPFLLGHSYASNFQHLHDFEPHPMNHCVPHYGIFSKYYFGRLMKSQQKEGEKYGTFKKNHGPPHYNRPADFDPVDKNEFLLSRNIPLDEVLHPSAHSKLTIETA